VLARRKSSWPETYIWPIFGQFQTIVAKKKLSGQLANLRPILGLISFFVMFISPKNQKKI
jgi:hypothetical protein